jgi:hypothetical protein
VFVAVGILGVVVGVVGFAVPSVRRIEILVPDHDAGAAGPLEPVLAATVAGTTVDSRDSLPVLLLAEGPLPPSSNSTRSEP